MKEINSLLELYENTDDMPAALATVIRTEGSSYRRTGARMLIYENGRWKGGISGGCLEKDVLKNAKLVMLEQKARTIRYDTSEDSSDNIGIGLGCNGLIDILISPLKKGHPNNPLEVLKTCTEGRAPKLLISVIKNETGSGLTEGDMFQFSSKKDISAIFKNKPIAAKITEDIDFVLKTKKTKIIDYQQDRTKKLSLLFEILPPNIQLVIVGSNYDIYPMSETARVLGWKISVIANPLKLDKSIFKIADIHASHNGQIPNLKTDSRTAVILMSHDYKTDLKYLRHYFNSDVGYIGLLGPRKRGDKILSDLRKEGIEISPEQLTRIFTPTGLDIGANTPEEIALSVLAEIRAFFSKRAGGFLIRREGSIHG